MNVQREGVTSETRLVLLEREVEVLKLRDADIRAWQESVNRTSYKIESLERSLDDTRERLDDLRDELKAADSAKKLENQAMQAAILSKIEEMTKSKTEEKKTPSTSWQSTVETIVKIIFVILIIAAGFLGIKLPGGV